MTLNFRKINENTTTPVRGTEYSAGLDLYADIDKETVTIEPNETLMVGTGICVEIPDGYFGAVFARSGIAFKRGLRPANCVGVIDSDYRGEIKVALHNDSALPQTIANGERIAQLVITPYVKVELKEVDILNDSDRGAGGFGSTGRK